MMRHRLVRDDGVGTALGVIKRLWPSGLAHLCSGAGSTHLSDLSAASGV